MKLFRFHYSPYARKVEMMLALLGRPAEIIEVPYGERRELAALTGGYVHVPVLQEDDGRVIVESRAICEHLIAGPGGAKMVPAPLAGPIWAYHDWVDGPLEDVLFRLATPIVRDRRTDPWERALYVIIKERKFGAGCVDAWARAKDDLVARGRALLAPTVATLRAQPFLFGERPTLADCALYGNLAMISCDPELPGRMDEVFPGYVDRMLAFASSSNRSS